MPETSAPLEERLLGRGSVKPRLRDRASRLIERRLHVTEHIWSWSAHRCAVCDRHTWWVEINFGCGLCRGVCTKTMDEQYFNKLREGDLVELVLGLREELAALAPTSPRARALLDESAHALRFYGREVNQ